MFCSDNEGGGAIMMPTNGACKRIAVHLCGSQVAVSDSRAISIRRISDVIIAVGGRCGADARAVYFQHNKKKKSKDDVMTYSRETEREFTTIIAAPIEEESPKAQ
eukprot:scaffold63114_cov60-Attheya_sp.AAC.2